MTDEVSMLRLVISQRGTYSSETKAALTPGKLESYLLNGHLEAPADGNLCMN